MTRKITFASLFALLTPFIAFAALDGLSSFLTAILSIIQKQVIPIFFGLAIIFFFYGMGQFILHDAGNEKGREDGKRKMLWGIIALFVMASIMGIIGFLGSSLGISTGTGSSSQQCGGGPDQPDCLP